MSVCHKPRRNRRRLDQRVNSLGRIRIRVQEYWSRRALAKNESEFYKKLAGFDSRRLQMIEKEHRVSSNDYRSRIKNFY